MCLKSPYTIGYQYAHRVQVPQRPAFHFVWSQALVWNSCAGAEQKNIYPRTRSPACPAAISRKFRLKGTSRGHSVQTPAESRATFRLLRCLGNSSKVKHTIIPLLLHHHLEAQGLPTSEAGPAVRPYFCLLSWPRVLTKLATLTPHLHRK